MGYRLFKSYMLYKIIALSMIIACSGLELKAQLNIIPKSEPFQVYTVDNALPYDSLTNIENYAALPGQTLFMSGIRDSSRGYMETFFKGNFMTEKPNIYGTENTFDSTPANKVDGKYFDVVKVWLKQGPFGGNGCCILLREKESGEDVYYKPTLYPKAMMCVGYYEKLKRHIGRPFRSLEIKAETMSGDVLRMDEGKDYKCVDIAVELNGGGPILIMENSDGQRVKGHPSGESIEEFVSYDDIDECERRFGKKFGKDIAMRHVVSGMTSEMVLAAWGEPFLKRSMDDEGTAKEYWRYAHDRSIVLEDGIVVLVYL